MQVIGGVPLLALLIPAMPAHADLSEADGMIGISAREVGWAVRFPAQGYTLLAERDRPDGRAHYSLFAHAWIGLNVSFFIEPAGGDAGACDACLPTRWARIGFQ